MNIEINLLPWRALKRTQEKKALIALLLISLVLGLFILFSVNYYVETLINYQGRRNTRLQGEIVLLSRQINEIKTFKDLIQSLNSRIDIIKKLQLNRILIVHFFDELSKIVPDDVYLTYAQREGAQLKVFGRAESNNTISMMMRNIELNRWFHKPILTEIKKNKADVHPVANEFKLSFLLRDKV